MGKFFQAEKSKYSLKGGEFIMDKIPWFEILVVLVVMAVVERVEPIRKIVKGA